METYKLKIVQSDWQKAIDFTNNTNNFVEVVFTIDGKDIRDGNPYSETIRGYCFPPHYQKNIKRTKIGRNLEFAENGIIKAYIFRGKGEFKNEEVDYDVPPFIRYKLYAQKKRDENFTALIQRRLNRKAIFRRAGNTPSKVLEIGY